MPSEDCLLEPALNMMTNSSHAGSNIMISSYDFDNDWNPNASQNQSNYYQHTSSSNSPTLIEDPLKPMGALLASSNLYSSTSFALPSVSSASNNYYASTSSSQSSHLNSSHARSCGTEYPYPNHSPDPSNSQFRGARAQQFSFPMPRVHVNALEINVGYQNYHNSIPFPTKKKQNDSDNETKKPMHDAYDLEPLSFFKNREHEASDNYYRNRGIDCLKSPLGEFGHMDKVFESLDKLIPEMDQDLFQPSELHSLTEQDHLSRAESYQHSLPMLSPRFHPELSSRNLLQNMLMSHSKVLAPLSSLVSHRSTKHLALCKVPGCERRVRSKGFCKTHGGGRKCIVENCNKSSQNGEFCIGHGGGKKCRHDGCAKAAQSHGLCKAHGGGARCKFPSCTKSSQGGGLCRAHGGGKRCQALDCQKGAQRGNFCATHGGFRNCKFDGCVRTDRGGGFCEVHRRGRLCKVKSCKKLARNDGMCTMHIRAEKQTHADENA